MGYKKTAKEAGITQHAVAKQRKRGVPEEQIIAGARARGSARKAITDEEYIQAVRRKALADAEKIERENKERSSELINGAEHHQAVCEMITTAKSRLLMIADELCDRLATESNPVKCREMLREKIRQSLSELAAKPAA